MCNKHESLVKNNTYDLLAHCKPMCCKWVDKIETTYARKIVKYKTWLVAWGFIQTYGIYYDQNFSPIIKFKSIWTIISFNAIQQDMHIVQFSIHIAFLHVDLDEEIYML
jgi:hypothetical protein